MKPVFALISSAACLVLPTDAQDAKRKPRLIPALERSVLYHPRPYSQSDTARFLQQGGKRLSYRTEQGSQSAWLLPPANGGNPKRLWIVCAGNGSLGLDFANFCRSLPFGNDAWLMVDYPGYGECEGASSPGAIRANVREAIKLAAAEWKWKPAELAQKGCVFGHSLGCAAALLAVQEHGLRAAILIAPFTSTPEMAQRMGFPKETPLQHVFDNRTGMRSLQGNHGKAWIFHGRRDFTIPCSMSEAMASEFPNTVSLQCVDTAGHADILRISAREIAAAMEKARQVGQMQ